MVWRGSTDFKDRLFASLVYIFPLIVSIPFGIFLFQEFPQIELIYLPLFILGNFIYSSIPFGLGGFLIFLVLFLAVVRNEKISHFVRFNTMQAILIDILLALFGLIINIFRQGMGDNLLIQTLFNMIFLATLAACLYSIVLSVLGKYAEIPTISEVAYSQVRW